MANKNLRTIKELFLRSRKSNIYFLYLSHNIRLNFTNYLIMKIHNKRELKNITTNHSADIDYKDFRKCTNKLYSFFTIDNTLPANNPVRFRKNFLDSL